MLPDRVSNPGPLTYESGALPIALRGPAMFDGNNPVRSHIFVYYIHCVWCRTFPLCFHLGFGEICNFTLQVARLGVGWTVYFHKGDWVDLQE